MKRKIITATLEIGIVMFLLLLNVLMRYYTKDAAGATSLEFKLDQTFTFENILLSFGGGVISYVILQIINNIRSKSPNS